MAKKTKKVSGAARSKVEEHDADIDGVDDEHESDEVGVDAAPVERSAARPGTTAVGSPVQYQKGSGWFGIILIALFVLGIVASMLLD